jgi:hypothetical protein
MKREVIQELLNLNGIEAVSLATRKMRPVFHGLNQQLDERQKMALGQGLLQVLENMVEGFDQFEFYFLNHTVFIYKQTSGLVLLVLASQDLELKSYQIAIGKFRHILEQDIYSGVTLFKQISGTATQPGKIFGDNSVGLASRQLVSASLSSLPSANLAGMTANGNPNLISQIVKPIDKIKQSSVALETWIVQLNLVGGVAAQYLGKMIASNYWKSTRSPGWLEQFQVDRNAQLSHPVPGKSCSQAEAEDLKKWIIAFILQCKQVIRNFDQILVEKMKDTPNSDLIKQILVSDRTKV